MIETQSPPQRRSILNAAPTVLAVLAIAALVAWAAGDGSPRAAGVPTVWICAMLAFAVQWVAFVPAYRAQTERYYDLTGGITYLAVTAAALALSPQTGARSWLLAAMIAVWATRLSSFLFRRVRRDGGDGRFDAVKPSAPRFLVYWTLQGLWVFLTAAAALAAITSGSSRPVGGLDAIGVGLWTLGMSIEIAADRQKAAFRRDPANSGRFIRTGLWAWSRHPNYFGEIVLWIGVAIVASATHEGWRWATWVSPLFVVILLTRVSGVPILEARADERWGGDDAYEAYKRRTPVLVPRPARRSSP